MDVTEDREFAEMPAEGAKAAAAPGGQRMWVRPFIVAIVVVGGWAALVIPADDGQGLATWEFLIIAAGLFAVMVWRGSAWGRARMAGAGRSRLVARAIVEGIAVGVVIGIVTFLVAQYRVETESPNLLGVLIVIPWIVIGAILFALLCFVSIAGRRAEPARR